MAERAGLFEEAQDIDVSGFTPKKPVRAEPPPEAVREVSEKVNFRSREASPKPPKKADRRYRTGRNIPLATKISANASNLLYSIHDEHQGKENWTIGQIIEFGLEAFKRDLDRRKGSE